MIDLKEQTGLDIVYDVQNNVMIVEGRKMQPTVRRLKDMADVIFDRKWLGKADTEQKLYYMFRDVSREEDAHEIEKSNLRYDITVIPAGALGHEFVKTAGHSHPIVPNTNVTYTELYEVVKGEGLYLLQKTDGKKVRDVYFIKAKKGDKIIIPPGYAHITINTQDDILVMSNWVARDFKSVYGGIKELKGGVYFVTAEKTLKNPVYHNMLNVIKFKKPDKCVLLGLRRNEPIYNMIRNPYRLKFLTEPENHKRLFSHIMDKPFEEVPLDQ